jgi:hypothetical protein
MISVNTARGEIERRLTLALRREIQPHLPVLYRRGARQRQPCPPRSWRSRCRWRVARYVPYVFSDLLADEWWRANRHGLTEEL